MTYDPIELTKAVNKVVSRGIQRKYFRFRGGRWYGGIATADCVGCNLRCVFCWGWYARDRANSIGKFYNPNEVYNRLISIAKRRRYRQVRLSGGEPTLNREHLVKLLELVSQTPFIFILETNGILIGWDKSYARDLAKFPNLHVRVSIKGTNPKEFSRLTGANPDAFYLQLKALENLLDEGVSVHPAVMLSFSDEKSYKNLISMLREIDRSLAEDVEEEYVFLYPHVVKKLREAKIWPRIAYTPNNIPEELI
ncbi:MAG: molybdenum cofactor biosynthesis protein MoaA [Thermoprotei archaeon]|nr:MAG: molybdenum cofactor biosynthesis protein MoaA [Thermoprotei archaeon]